MNKDEDIKLLAQHNDEWLELVGTPHIDDEITTNDLEEIKNMDYNNLDESVVSIKVKDEWKEIKPVEEYVSTTKPRTRVCQIRWKIEDGFTLECNAELQLINPSVVFGMKYHHTDEEWFAEVERGGCVVLTFMDVSEDDQCKLVSDYKDMIHYIDNPCERAIGLHKLKWGE